MSDIKFARKKSMVALPLYFTVQAYLSVTMKYCHIYVIRWTHPVHCAKIPKSGSSSLSRQNSLNLFIQDTFSVTQPTELQKKVEKNMAPIFQECNVTKTRHFLNALFDIWTATKLWSWLGKWTLREIYLDTGCWVMIIKQMVMCLHLATGMRNSRQYETIGNDL